MCISGSGLWQRKQWLEIAGRSKSVKNGKSRLARGGSFLRENSSNGGKAIRTFWLHTRCG